MHHVVASGEAADPRELWKSRTDYEQNPSMKLNSLVSLCMHHLASDGRHPLMVDYSKRGVLKENLELPATRPDPDCGPADVASAPDKIFVYAAFPSQNMYIQRVLALYGIESLVFSGLNSLGERTAILEKFKRSGRDGPRVLIVSNVGLYGLNVAFANILIVVVGVVRDVVNLL